MLQGSFDHLIYPDYLQEKLNIFSDDSLDSELFSIVVELVNIPALVDYIFFQGFVHELDTYLVPTPQYITDRPFEVRGPDFISMRRFHQNNPQIKQVSIYI